MLDFIKSMDYLRPAPALRLNTKTRFQKVFGRIVSIISTIIIILLASYFLIETFRRERLSLTGFTGESLNPTFNFFNSLHALY